MKAIEIPAATAAGTLRADPARGVAAMVAGGALLGTMGVFLLESGQDPLLAVWFRCAFGLLALSLWVAARDGLSALWPASGGGWPLLGNSALMLLNWWLFFAAVQRVPIGVATVVVHMQPFWMMALAALIWREVPSRRQGLATVVALLGLVLATGVGTQALSAAPGLGQGLLMCLAASLSYAVATLLAHRSAGRAGSPAAAWRLAWWQCALGCLVLLPVPLWQGWPAWGPAWGWLAGLGVLHTGLAYGLLYGGMAQLDTGRVALLQFVYPAVAIAVDAAVYGHALRPAQVLGVLLMALALWRARPAAH